jgi:hypothetical protein
MEDEAADLSPLHGYLAWLSWRELRELLRYDNDKKSMGSCRGT